MGPIEPVPQRATVWTGRYGHAAVRGVGPTLIPRPQRMYLAFGNRSAPRPAGTVAATWPETARERTRLSLEDMLANLQVVRADDPFRKLNPLAWPNAVQPADHHPRRG